jgi:hypothetical protein
MFTRTIACALLLLVVFSAIGQNSFFDDATTIAALKQRKDIKNLQASFQRFGGIAVDGNGIIQLSGEVSGFADRLGKAIAANVARAGLGVANDPTPPATGAVAPQPVPGASGDSVDEDMLQQEIKFILFILLDTDVADYKRLKAFPQKFVYLKQINVTLPVAVGTAGAAGAGFDFSALVIGATDFFIHQAKKEMVQVYLKGWYDHLDKDPIIKPLLPQTLNILNAFIQDDALNLATYGGKWKAAFQEDLRNIPKQLQDDTLVTAIVSKFNPDAPLKRELVPVIAGGDAILYNLYLKKPLVTVLSDLAIKYRGGPDVNDLPLFKRLVILADILSHSAGELDNNNVYKAVRLADLSKLDAGAWQVVLQLLYARNKDILPAVFNANGAEFFGNLALNPAQSLAFGQLVQQTVSTLVSYQTLVTGSNANAGINKQLSLDDARKLFDVSFQLFDNIAGYFGLFDPANPLLAGYTKKVRPYLSGLSQMGEGISTSDYGKVLDGFVAVIVAMDPKNKDLKTVVYLQRFGSFMVNVLTTKDPEKIEAAISELVLKDQYQIKNNKRFCISVAAYPGVTAGIEWVSKYQTDIAGNIDYSLPRKSVAKASLAPYLPLGVDFNFGNKDSSSYSIFLQFIDLGAVMNYRLTSDSAVSSNPNITFKELLSPGLAVLRRFRNSPLSLGVSANFTPSLRTVNQKGNVYQPNAFRLGIFLAVDVTALMIHTSRKNSIN